jgi:hypothetical protein
MYGQHHDHSDNLQPTVFYLRSNQLEKPVKVKVDGIVLRGTALTDFAETVARNVVHQLLDTSAPFAQTDDDQMCKNCSFNQICQRG